jgi:hypothetical protein
MLHVAIINKWPKYFSHLTFIIIYDEKFSLSLTNSRNGMNKTKNAFKDKNSFLKKEMKEKSEWHALMI